MDEHAQLLQKLQDHVHPKETLLRHGFVLKEADDWLRTMPPMKSNLKPLARRAIVLDWVFVDKKKELARFAAIAALTREELINHIVVLIDIKEDAVAVTNGRRTFGWQSLRDELILKHADSQTIFVGHAVHNTLKELHLLHDCIVDSAILATEALGILGVNVEVQKRKRRPSPLDWAVAARDVVVSMVNKTPEFVNWVEDAAEIHKAYESARSEDINKSGAKRARKKSRRVIRRVKATLKRLRELPVGLLDNDGSPEARAAQGAAGYVKIVQVFYERKVRNVTNVL
ncbi:hypothetical protein QBC46DRAFT_411233 [Diplogelasinospora grovesii]|uniref:Uncharacterized protein n=1 Tax=Diplogelasinospora grovesii TaxID=303347 RepID=A0AAN6N1D7_9PEZI|nr:hypothetical protein QBC46DRAFT_411233 [Diplogelasinospora grovesii]